MNEIEKGEWLEVIKSLSCNKVGGLSKITYDIIKELSGDMKELMHNFSSILGHINILIY